MKKIIFYSVFIICMGIICPSVFAQSIVGSSDEDAPIDLFEGAHTKNRKPAILPFVREADIAWKKEVWRRIDFKQPFNQFFFYPIGDPSNPGTQNGLESFVAIVWQGIVDGTIKAYDSDQFKREFTTEELVNRFEKVREDSNWIYDEDLGYEVLKVVRVETKFEPADVKKMELKEVWFIDKQYSSQKNRIIGFSFTRESYDLNRETGERTYAGDEDLFWIKYDGDMAVRQLLANKEVFSPNNDADRRSFDDIFLQRYFDSYIIKESNVQNRSVSTYLTGTDALLESERIKNEIMNKEIDMWEY